MNLEALTNAQLLALSGDALAELRRRGVVRTANAPAGDLAERLVAEAMGGALAHNSQKSWDVLVPAPLCGAMPQRVQVKARVVTDPTNAGQRQVSAFRSWDCKLVRFVLFEPTYRVRAAALLPTAVVRAHSSHVEFTASDRVLASDPMLALGEDWTARLQAAVLWDETRETHTRGLTVKEELVPTPAGAVRSITILTADGQVVEFTEYSSDGAAIMRTGGQFE
jgi:hypothetical protein